MCHDDTWLPAKDLAKARVWAFLEGVPVAL